MRSKGTAECNRWLVMGIYGSRCLGMQITLNPSGRPAKTRKSWMPALLGFAYPSASVLSASLIAS
jgi:hypothetical protein